jgi:O-antigen/teichoic acid export membrane protein
LKSNLLKNIFSSGLQAIAVQVLGVTFFLIASFYLSKDDFGIISWANALCIMLTTLLSVGMEQVVFRRIAVSSRSDWAATAFLLHAFAGSAIGLIILSLFSAFGHDTKLQFLPLFFIAQAFTYMGTPLKQMLNAKQKFTPYGIIAVCSNTLKIVLSLVYVKGVGLTMGVAVGIMILCAAIEFFSLLIYVRKNEHFRFHFRLQAYKKLVKESMPQYISVIFDSSLSRIDWILLGILGTAAMTAEYSFAYRAFELARLPITVVAPILLAKFAKILSAEMKMDEGKKAVVKDIFQMEMFIAVFIPLLLNILWTPVLESLFHGKYGANNSLEFFLLSLNIPFLFAINLVWTICFTGKLYRKIANVTIGSAVANLILNIILIPKFSGTGAAIAFLATTILQLLAYSMLLRTASVTFRMYSIVAYFIMAGIAYITVIYALKNIFLQLVVSAAIYIVLCIIFRLIKRSHLQTLQVFLKK